MFFSFILNPFIALNNNTMILIPLIVMFPSNNRVNIGTLRRHYKGLWITIEMCIWQGWTTRLLSVPLFLALYRTLTKNFMRRSKLRFPNWKSWQRALRHGQMISEGPSGMWSDKRGVWPRTEATLIEVSFYSRERLSEGFF